MGTVVGGNHALVWYATVKTPSRSLRLLSGPYAEGIMSDADG